MGVKQLWPLLNNYGVVEKWDAAADATAVRRLAEEVDGKVIAVDLPMWVMQATEQTELGPHFSTESAAVKVAFERTLQWLRFGITPVFVVEGRAPAEKADTQSRRLMAQCGWTRTGTGGGDAAFTALCRCVGRILQAMVRHMDT